MLTANIKYLMRDVEFFDWFNDPVTINFPYDQSEDNLETGIEYFYNIFNKKSIYLT